MFYNSHFYVVSPHNSESISHKDYLLWQVAVADNDGLLQVFSIKKGEVQVICDSCTIKSPICISYGMNTLLFSLHIVLSFVLFTRHTYIYMSVCGICAKFKTDWIMVVTIDAISECIQDHIASESDTALPRRSTRGAERPDIS